MSLLRRHFLSLLANASTMTFSLGAADRSLPAQVWLIESA